MLKRLVNEARFTLRITTAGPLLVRSGHATLSGPDMTPVLTYRDGDWQVFLPGSSLKGVIRSHLEKVCRTLRPEEGVVCNPFHELPKADAFCGRKFQERKDANSPVTSDVAYRDSCPICRVFGSTEFIGRVSINDAYLVDDRRARPTEARDGVGIDRLTGGSYGGALFELEVVSPQVSFDTDVYVRNFETWQLGMLLLVVQDMEDGLIRVGSGTSRGLGSVTGEVKELIVSYLGLLDGKPAEEIWGLGKLQSEDERRVYGTQMEDVLTVEPPPADMVNGIRRQATFQGESLVELRRQAVDAFIKRLQGWTVPEEMKLERLGQRR